MLYKHPAFTYVCCANSLELGHFWDTTSSSATLEFPNMLWKLEVHFLLEDYRLSVERLFASPNDTESYADGSASSL
jgi:hypothetical protein